MAVLEATPVLFQTVTAERPRRRGAGPGQRSSPDHRGLDRCSAVAIFVTFCVSISVGDFPIPLRDVVPAILGFGNEDADFIVRTLRLPRALTGLLVGVAFGLSGADLPEPGPQPAGQPRHHRHHAGASAAAVFVIVVVGGSYLQVSVGAFAGALLTALAIYLLAWKRGVSPYRLVLVGIGIAAMLGSVTAYLLTRAEIFDAQRATVWLTGSLNGRSWDHVRPLALALVVLVPAVAAAGRGRCGRCSSATTPRTGSGSASSGRGSASSSSPSPWPPSPPSSAGPIEFVAFVAPPIARRLTRTSLTIVPAALGGGLLVLLADLIARRAFAPTELPVGVVTGVIGAPYLLWLLARANKVGRGG